MWKINAGRRSVFAADFIERNVVAIGWREAGDPLAAKSRAAMLELIAATYPDSTDRQNEVGSAQVWRFIHEIQIGDPVTTYDPIERVYHLGAINGAAVYRPGEIEQLPTQRSVRWTSKVSRDALSMSAKGKLGAILTLFKVAPSAVIELQALAAGGTRRSGPATVEPDEDLATEAADPYATLEDQALERIKDRLLALGWEDMQEIVAALLRALGYRTIVSPTGPDRGKDIIASPDGFGFQSPRIMVEVKHRKGAMGAPEIRAFLGGRHPEDRGLYVSTGGFTREAQLEAERASTVTHLMALDGLARALIENYEKIDERGRALLPLTRLYWPS